MLATGVLFTFLLLFSEDKLKWSPKAAAATLYLAAFPEAMGYLFWEIEMKKGNVVLLGSLSFFTPVLSTLISCVLLRVAFGADLLVGCLLVTAGAWTCKLSVNPRDETNASG